jgi:hypothetical protein
VDEAGLFYNMLLDKTLHFKGENYKGGKQRKLCLAVFLFVNANGAAKLQPLFIVKFINPRCLKNIKILQSNCTANSKAWMISKIFENEVYGLNAEAGTQN